MKYQNLLKTFICIVPVAVAGCQTLQSDIRPVFGGRDVASYEAGNTPYERGKTYLAAGQHGLAIKNFNSALTRDPWSVEALNGLGAAYDILHRYKVAEAFYSRALELDPNSVQTHNNLGYSFLLQGRVELARAQFGEAREYGGDNATVLANWRLTEEAPSRAVAMVQNEAEAKPEVKAMVRMSNRGKVKWVERTSGSVQTLVSDPAPNLLVKISAAGAEPKLVNSTPKQIKRVAVQKLFLTPLPIPRPSVILLKQATVPVSPQPVAAVPGQISVTPKQIVPLPKQAFAWPPEEQPLVEISNGTGRSRMAARTHDFLSGNGVAVRWLTNADHYGHRETTIFYTPGWQNHARRLARLFPAEVDFQLIDSHRSDLRVELGADLNEFDRTVLMDQGRTSYVSSK